MVAIERKKNVIKQTAWDRVFDAFNMIVMCVFLFIMLYPLYYTLIASVSNATALGLGQVTFFPVGFNLDAYENVFMNKEIWTGYLNSIVYTVGSTLYGLAIMLPLAYVLSKKDLFGRSVITWFFLFTMYFSGGLIPTYMLIHKLGLPNTPWVMIVGSVSVYNMVVTRTFFMSSIPGELYESAKIDGASDFRCFFQIALPLSSAIIAVMALFFAVGSWNAYFNAFLYITKKEMFPLQVVLRNILIVGQMLMMNPETLGEMTSDQQQFYLDQARMAETMKYAVIYIASAPLLIAYPFVQKYFVRGVMIGSLKG